MDSIKVNNSILKIVGLLGEYPKTKRSLFQKDLLKNGFKEDAGSKEQKIILKDIFYPDFRDLMFIKSDNKSENELLSRRFYTNEIKKIVFVKREINSKKIINRFTIDVIKCEVFLFGEQIGLFSLTLKIEDNKQSIEFISDIINQCRNFDSEIDINSTDGNFGPKWHQWISKHYLCGTELRDDEKDIKVDDFSGSKFKVYSVIDCEVCNENRRHLLYDLGTSSPLNSSLGKGLYSPHPDYYEQVMKNNISIFNNWESLCLFDSFTVVGNGIMYNDASIKTWEDSYFRVYVFRLFFKYNLYCYNSELYVNTIKLRNQFEKFLNNYNLSHISFNFLPNEIFNKIGNALHLDEELIALQNRINRISSAIQEEKQSKTNALLQFVSILGGLSSVQSVFDGLSIAQKYLGWSNTVFYTLLVLILLSIGLGLLAFLMPELVNKISRKIKGIRY